ncbi:MULTISPECIES: class F sortase [Amycolatopsis]|uniref:Class F sortase n=1 Tax=Amycolatopsis albidoflavus TaxID=102226 RepID=A0ABW5HTN6_9PSEU
MIVGGAILLGSGTGDIPPQAAPDISAVVPHSGMPSTGTAAAPETVSRSGRYSSITGAASARLTIRALDVDAPLVPVAATGNSLDIPRDVHTVGWYIGTTRASDHPTAPAPGQPGVAVLAGHVNWAGQGPGAFHDLRALRPGDVIDIRGANKTTTHWTVSEAPLDLRKNQLPSNLFSNVGPPRIALVTCGGPYDSRTGNYRDNVIVWGQLAS